MKLDFVHHIVSNIGALLTQMLNIFMYLRFQNKKMMYFGYYSELIAIIFLCMHACFNYYMVL